jgi:hypothetical protein
VNKFLVLVYRTNGSPPVAVIGSWPSERDARAWAARARVLYPALEHIQITEMFGARQVDQVVDLLVQDEPPAAAPVDGHDVHTAEALA